MLILDSITIAICAVLVLLTILSSLTDVFFRKIKEEEKSGDMERKPVSVILISDNNSRELKDNLPVILTQDYPAGYEVIVVVCKDEDGTRDVLKAFDRHENLYTTFVPDSSRYVSRRKLAITLGVKASHNEWILLADACCRPRSDKWIDAMSSRCGDGTDMVFGYSNYSDEARSFQRFNSLHREYAMMYDAFKKRAYGMDGCNLMFKKSMFMAGDGFRDNLKYIRGEYDFIMNKYASGGNVAVNISPDSFIVGSAPTKKEWHNKKLFYGETRKHLQRRFVHRMIFNLDMFSLNACFLAALGSAAYAVYSNQWFILPFSFIALFCPFIVRTLNARRVIRLFAEDIGCWKAVPFELYTIWHNLKFIIRYKLSDKYEFISHKL